jgi:hypothetical protein
LAKGRENFFQKKRFEGVDTLGVWVYCLPMNSEQMDILTLEFGFVFPYDGNRCTDGNITITRKNNRFLVARPGKLTRKLVTFDQVLRFIIQHSC